MLIHALYGQVKIQKCFNKNNCFFESDFSNYVPWSVKLLFERILSKKNSELLFLKHFGIYF